MSGRGFEIGAYKPGKTKPGPIPTLGQLAKHEPRWLWLACTNSYSRIHKAAMPLAPLIIRWGAETSSNMLRRCARCSRCGTKGAYTFQPSVMSVAGMVWQPFPVEDRAFICRQM